MRTLASESYTIAWFKIADFVARGEKERALTVYRFLMHSVPEPALSYQLEGDILLAFDDDAALDRYHIAANLYKKSGKLQQAISVYEHVSLFKEDERILEALMDSYFQINNMQGLVDAFTRLSKICFEQQQDQFLLQTLHRYSSLVPCITISLLHTRFIRSLMLYGQPTDTLSMHIQDTLDLLLDDTNNSAQCSKELNKFLIDLKALNYGEYEKAEKYLKLTN